MSNTSGSHRAGFEPVGWIGGCMGRIALPVGAKFVTSVIGTVALMILLAATGLAELSKANGRAAEVINDHTKTAGLMSSLICSQVMSIVSALVP